MYIDILLLLFTDFLQTHELALSKNITSHTFKDVRYSKAQKLLKFTFNALIQHL